VYVRDLSTGAVVELRPDEAFPTASSTSRHPVSSRDSPRSWPAERACPPPGRPTSSPSPRCPTKDRTSAAASPPQARARPWAAAVATGSVRGPDHELPVLADELPDLLMGCGD
jgi:hypothetical protein